MKGTTPITGLYITGSEAELTTLRELAIGEGFSAYWIHAKKRAIPGKQTRASRWTPAAETRLGRIIIAKMRTLPMKEWHSDDLGVFIEESGYKATSISPQTTYLEREGWINRVAPKTFILTAVGRGDVQAGKIKSGRTGVK